MTYRPNVETTLNNLGTTPLSAATTFPALNVGSDLGNATMTALLAWVQTQATDLSGLTTLSSLPSDGSGKVLLLSSSGLALLPTSLLGSGSGTAPSAPVNTAVPTITGTAQVGQTLTTSQGTWSNSPTSYAYQWRSNGAAISGATSGSYVPVSGDVGNTLTVTVTATNAGGSASATSAATSAVIAASSGTAPGPVTSLAAGTPTGSTIPLTWTAPTTGTAPLSYVVMVGPHGGTLSAASGTFGATGGTITGLAASTAYDISVTATNGAGSSTAATLSNISTGAGSGVTWSGATPTFAAGKFGQAIVGGTGSSGSAAIAIPTNQYASTNSDGPNDQASASISFWFKSVDSNTGPLTNDFLGIVGSSGTNSSFAFKANKYFSIDQNGYIDQSGAVVRDQAWHFVQLTVVSHYGYLYSDYYVDGAHISSPRSGATPYLHSGTGSFFLDPTQLAAGDLIDDVLISSDPTALAVPTAARARTGSTLLLLSLDGSGAGS